MLDPRSKFILSVYYSIIIVASKTVEFLVPEFIFLLLVIIFYKKIIVYLKWLRLIASMVIFFGLIMWLLSDLYTSLIASLKLLNITTVFFVFFNSVTPENLGNSFVKAGLPYTFAFVLMTGLNFVSVIGKKAKNVINAQRSRGIPVEPGFKALRHYPAFFAPLLIQSFQLAENLAEAIEARGFGLKGRSFLKEYKMRLRDWILIISGLIAVTLFLWHDYCFY